MVLALLAGVAATPAHAGIPGLQRTELRGEFARLWSVDDAGRTTYSVHEGRRLALLRRLPDGRTEELLRQDDERHGRDAACISRPDLTVWGNGAGDLIALWARAPGGGPLPCGAGHPAEVHAAIGRAGGPLRALAPASVRLVALPSARQARLEDGGRLRALMETTAASASTGTGIAQAADMRTNTLEIDADGIRVGPDSPDGGFFAQTPRERDGSRLELVDDADGARLRRTPGLGGPAVQTPLAGLVPSLAVGLPAGRTTVVGRRGEALVSLAVGANGAVTREDRLGVADATFPLHRFFLAIDQAPDGTTVAAVPGTSGGAGIRILGVGPDGSGAIVPWPAPQPQTGTVAVDRHGSLLLAEGFGTSDAGPDAWRIRRLSAFGGEDGIDGLPRAAFVQLETADGGAFAAFVPAAHGSGMAGTLLTAGNDAAPPTAAARVPTVRGAPRTVVVRVRCDEGCEVRDARHAAAARSASTGSAVARRAPAGARLPAGRTMRLRVPLTGAQRRAARRAHRVRRTARLRVTLRTRDAAGNAGARRVLVRLRPPRTR